MKKVSMFILALAMTAFVAKAQDVVVIEEEENGLKISGSVDTYYKYDLSGYPNIGTSFADEQNSVSIGMIDLVLEQTVGKASFVGEISFGPRGQYQSLLNGDDGNSFHIQNLYVSYALTDALTITAGYMGTFVGYEVISPAGNFNYSTSYLFTNGPFQNAGIKADIAITDRIGLMVGLFNDWNVYQDFNGVSDFGAQLSITPIDGWDVYFNYITGFNQSIDGNLSEFDITTGFQITDALYIGANFATAASKFDDDTEDGFTGFALYPQYAFSDAVAFGLRYENFSWKDAESYNAFTFTLPVTAGPLTFIPEYRIDTSDEDMFVDSDMAATGVASQFLLAAVFAF